MNGRTFFIDIDQTISTGYLGANLAESITYYREHGVSVPTEVARYPDLFQLPAVLAQHEQLPGARSGVHQCARHGAVAYATVRAPDVATITHAWLRQHGFPSPDRVLICQSAAQKLLAIAEHPGQAVLVDDRWRKLLAVWPRLVEYAPDVAADLRERLTLVAFGASANDLPQASVVPVVPLVDWSEIGTVLTAFHEDSLLQAGEEGERKNPPGWNAGGGKKG